MAGGALVVAASHAADLDKSMARVRATFGDSAPAVEAWAKSANSVFLSDRQASSYAAAVGEAAQGLGLASDAAAKLVPNAIGVASQLAILKGVDVEASMESVAAALRGEYDATQRLIPALSANRIQQEALKESGKTRVADLTNAEKAQATLNIIIEDGTKILKGNADALDSPSAKWAKLKSQLDDTITSVGGGSLNVFGPVLTGISAVADEISKIPAGITGTVGTIAAVGVGLSGVASLATLAVGGFKSATKGISDHNSALITSEGELTNWGVAALGLSFAGAAAAGIQVLNQVLQGTVDTLDSAKFSSDQLNESVARGNWTSQVGELQKSLVTSNIEKFGLALESIVNPGGVVGGGTGKVLGTMNDQLQKTLETMTTLKSALSDESWDQFSKAFTAGLKGDKLKAAQELLKQAEDNSAAAAKGSAIEHDRLSKSTGDAAASTDKKAGADKDAAQSAKDHEKATKDLESAIKSMSTPLDQYASAMNVLTDGGKAAAQALDLSTQADNQIENASKMGKAVGDFKENIKGLPGTIDQTKLALGGYSDEQTKAIDSLSSLGKENQDYISGLIASGSSSDDVRAKAAALNAEYANQIQAVTHNTDETNAYLQVLGLTPDQVNTAIKLSGQEEAKAQLQILSGEIAGLTDKQQNEINMRVSTGDAINALALLNIYKAETAANFQDPLIATLLVQADDAQAKGDIEKETGIVGVATIIAQANVDAANNDFDAAKNKERIAIIAAQSAGVPLTQQQLDALKVDPNTGVPRTAPVTAVPHTDAANKALNDLKAPIEPILTPQFKFNSKAFSDSLSSLLPAWLRPGGTSTTPTPPPAVATPRPTAGVGVNPLDAAAKGGFFYTDQRHINITTNNPPGTPDMLKELKRAIKINGSELRRAVA